MDSFKEVLNYLCPENFCLIGDFNACVGEEQQLDALLLYDCPHINEYRCSKDKKANSHCGKFGGILDGINRRLNGDLQADFTFYGGRGSSVIDYAFVLTVYILMTLPLPANLIPITCRFT